MLTQLIHWLWKLQSRSESRNFRHSTTNIRRQQEQLLWSTLKKNTDCLYGQEYRFASVNSLKDFQRRVPVCDYEVLKSRIDEISEGKQNVLTSEPVLMMEPTGGSSGGGRLIPYTTTLRHQFQRAISAWMHDVLSAFPGTCHGRAYWSVSPAAQRPAKTDGGLRIGFDNDTEYLSGWQRWAMRRLLVTPENVSQYRNIENFQYATLTALFATEDLALISVWSPTFLTTLFARIPEWSEQIFGDIERGVLRLPHPTIDRSSTTRLIPRNRGRSALLQSKLNECGATGLFLKEVWPSLSLVSAWGDAAASMFVPRLRDWLPGVPFQPKGLLATEGVTSIPLSGLRDSALAIRSHVFEFQPTDADDDSNRSAKWAWELETGGRYRILLTTGGGLYRYAVGDEVEVTGFLNECPLLRFLGRTGAQSDLVGEKLHEQHVRNAIYAGCKSLDIEPSFSLLLPVMSGASPVNSPPGYLAILVIDVPARVASERRSLERQIAERIDTNLCSNSQYRYATGLGQLKRLDAWILTATSDEAWAAFEAECRQRGQKGGDVKPTALAHGAGWPDVFAPLHSAERIQ